MAEKTAVANLPTGDPLPVPSPPTAKPPKIPLSTILAAVPGNLDAFIIHLHKCMQTPSGIDNVLHVVGYCARLSANILDTASHAVLENSAHKLISLAFSLPPNTTFLLSSAPAAAPFASLAIKLATRLRALSTLLSDSRTFLRSWGLLGMYLAARSFIPGLLRKKSSSDEKKPEQTAAESLDKTIVLAQLISISAFQALENAWFLSSKGVFGLTPQQQGIAAKASTRFWMTYVGLEIGRLLVEYHRKTTGGDVESAEHKAWKEGWRRNLAKNVCWAPVTVNYSFDGGLSDTTLAVLGLIPGLISIRQLWKDTA